MGTMLTGAYYLRFSKSKYWFHGTITLDVYSSRDVNVFGGIHINTDEDRELHPYRVMIVYNAEDFPSGQAPTLRYNVAGESLSSLTSGNSAPIRYYKNSVFSFSLQKPSGASYDEADLYVTCKDQIIADETVVFRGDYSESVGDVISPVLWSPKASHSSTQTYSSPYDNGLYIESSPLTVIYVTATYCN